MLEVVKRACEAAGGIGNLANKLGCSRQALYQWDEVPRGRAIEIEEATNRKVPRHEMRPDLFNEDGSPKPQAAKSHKRRGSRA